MFAIDLTPHFILFDSPVEKGSLTLPHFWSPAFPLSPLSAKDGTQDPVLARQGFYHVAIYS